MMHQRLRARWAVAIAAVVFSAASSTADAPSTTAREVWQSIAIRGQRIGYGHLVETRSGVGEREVVTSDLKLQTSIKRFDGKLTLIVDQSVREDASGNLIDFTFTMNNPPASQVKTTGRVEGDVLILETTAAGNTTRTMLDRPADLKSPVWIDRRLEEQPLEAGKSMTFSMFDPQIGAIVSVRATGRGDAEFQLPDGTKQRGTRATLEFLSGLPGLTLECYFDAGGRGVLTESPLLGATTWNVSQAEALAEIPDDIDIGLSALIEVPKLPDPQNTREVEYRVTLPGGLADGLIPSDGLQSVSRVSPDTVSVTVRSRRPNDLSRVASTAPPDEKYLAATTFIRADDDEILRLADASCPPEAAPSEAAIALETAVHKWLTRKNMSTNLATASEVVRSREGDCTEHAVLLAALLRARKIPSRVVVGLVYWDQHSAFAGHAWTEAWLAGRWISLDATQAGGGIGADHIKLGDTSLADGDASLIASSVSVWQLLDKATLEIVQAKHAE